MSNLQLIVFGNTNIHPEANKNDNSLLNFIETYSQSIWKVMRMITRSRVFFFSFHASKREFPFSDPLLVPNLYLLSWTDLTA